MWASPPDWLWLISIRPLVVEPPAAGELVGTSKVNLWVALKVANEPVEVAEPLMLPLAIIPPETSSLALGFSCPIATLLLLWITIP